MAFKMKGFPMMGTKTHLKSVNDDVYMTVDGVPLTYGEYQTYDKTGRMPSGAKSRRNKPDTDLSEIIKKEEAMGIIRPKTTVSDDPIEGEEGYVG